MSIESMFLNKGFVRQGQHVRVRLEAFPFTRYGTLDGKVLTVSNDAIPVDAQQSSGNGETAKDTAGPLVFPVRVALGLRLTLASK
jgi:hemolysin D